MKGRIKMKIAKIAVSSSGKDLDALIAPLFGKCAYFIIVDTEDMSFETFDNESIALSEDAGVQAARFVASKGADVVITTNCGPNAVRTLSEAGVKLVVGLMGTVRQAIDNYKTGKLVKTAKANVEDHYGTGEGTTLVGGSAKSPQGGISIDRTHCFCTVQY